MNRFRAFKTSSTKVGVLRNDHLLRRSENTGAFVDREKKTPINSPVVPATEDHGPHRPKTSNPRNRNKSVRFEASDSEKPQKTVFGPRTSTSIYENSKTLFSVPTFETMTRHEESDNDEPMVQQSLGKETKSQQLRRLVSKSRTRPTTAHPSKRRTRSLKNFADDDDAPRLSKSLGKTLEQAPRSKRRRPKGAHHQNHPMLIPGAVDPEIGDELEELATNRTEAHAATERPANSPKLTFLPGTTTISQIEIF